MSLATLFKLPETSAEIAEWTFSNRADHDDIAAAIKRRHSVDIVKYAIEPVTEAGMAAFLLGHQAMHTQEAQILGIDSENFLSADFSEWWSEHANQHMRERQVLGI
jgi:hypothetical protein